MSNQKFMDLLATFPHYKFEIEEEGKYKLIAHRNTYSIIYRGNNELKITTKELEFDRNCDRDISISGLDEQYNQYSSSNVLGEKVEFLRLISVLQSL